jgi:hypothetical protein
MHAREPHIIMTVLAVPFAATTGRHPEKRSLSAFANVVAADAHSQAVSSIDD